MDHVTAFLLGVYLVPLGLVSLASARVDGRKPFMAAFLWVCAAGLLAWVGLTRPDGLFSLREVPDLTIQVVARLMTLF